MESSKDNDEDSDKSKKTDWGLIFSLLKNRGFTHQEILNLSYPQLNAYMKNINNPLAYSIVIPYMGSGDKDGKTKVAANDENKVGSKEELINIIADMNKDFL